VLTEAVMPGSGGSLREFECCLMPREDGSGRAGCQDSERCLSPSERRWIVRRDMSTTETLCRFGIIQSSSNCSGGRAYRWLKLRPNVNIRTIKQLRKRVTYCSLMFLSGSAATKVITNQTTLTVKITLEIVVERRTLSINIERAYVK
jgi:hypothetical protein